MNIDHCHEKRNTKIEKIIINALPYVPNRTSSKSSKILSNNGIPFTSSQPGGCPFHGEAQILAIESEDRHERKELGSSYKLLRKGQRSV